MSDIRWSRPPSLHALALALVFQGMSGLGGGIGLVADPSGAFVGLPLGWLRGSPFRDYLVPGLVLLTALGIAPLIAAWGLWADRAWSWVVGLAVGVALLAWLAVQIGVVGYPG